MMRRFCGHGRTVLFQSWGIALGVPRSGGDDTCCYHTLTANCDVPPSISYKQFYNVVPFHVSSTYGRILNRALSFINALRLVAVILEEVLGFRSIFRIPRGDVLHPFWFLQKH
jgi:hypothetical protein